MRSFCQIDDKFVPLYRIVWISAVPHFCGHDDCQREGSYEVQLESGETVWATGEEQAAAMKAIESWQQDHRSDLSDEES